MLEMLTYEHPHLSDGAFSGWGTKSKVVSLNQEQKGRKGERRQQPMAPLSQFAAFSRLNFHQGEMTITGPGAQAQ